MNKVKKLISIGVALIMMFTSIGIIPVAAEEVVIPGDFTIVTDTTYKNAKYGYKLSDTDGDTVNDKLELCYTGAPADYTATDSYKNRPWQSDASNIKTVVITGKPTKVGIYSFSNMSSLENVTLAGTESYIDVGAFQSDKGLKNMDFIKDAPITRINTLAFNGCTNINGVVTIPSTVTVVGAQAFQNTKINGLIFDGGTNKSNITLEKGLKYMGQLTNMYIDRPISFSSDVKTVKDFAGSYDAGVYGCTNPAQINVVVTNKDYFTPFGNLTADDSWYASTSPRKVEYCPAGKFEEYTLADGTRGVVSGKFMDNVYYILYTEKGFSSKTLEFITDGVETGTNLLNGYTTDATTDLHTIKDSTLANNAADVRKMVLGEGFTSVPMSFGTTSRYDKKYDNGKSGRYEILEELQLPSTMKKLEWNAFGGIRTLAKVNFEDTNLETIGALSFRYCPIQTITLPSTVKKIDQKAFVGNAELTTLYLTTDENLVIGDKAFAREWNQTGFDGDTLMIFADGGKITVDSTHVSPYCFDNDANINGITNAWRQTILLCDTDLWGNAAANLNGVEITNEYYDMKMNGNSVNVFMYNASSNQDYKLFVAEYNGDRFQKLTELSEGVVTAKKVFEKSIDLSSLCSEGNRYKVFLWEDFYNIKPLAEACDAELSPVIDNAEWITAPNTYSAADVPAIVAGGSNISYRYDSLALWDDSNSDGAYQSSEFKGLKMGPAPILRTDFNADKPVEKATVSVTGLGYYEFYINGTKVGDKVLEPFTTLYDEDCVYYSTYDVTDLIQNGENGMGAILGRGTYNPTYDHIIGLAAVKAGSSRRGKQKFKMTLSLEYADGSVEYVPTSTEWKASWSPIRYDSQAYGEYYDARMEEELKWKDNGWTKADFDDSSWASAELETKYNPYGTLALAPDNYNAVVNEYNNLDVTSLGNNTFRVDVGRVLTGWASLSDFVGVEGGVISLHYIENLNTWNRGSSDVQSAKKTLFYYKDKDGNEQNINTYAQTDYYVMKSGVNEWSPKFTLKSFRYIDITFPDGMTVTVDDVKDMVAVEEVHVNLEETGVFTSSNEIFNQTHEIAKNTLLNNMHSYISDTPLHENAPYLLDGVASAEWGLLDFDAADYLDKWLRDMRATQKENGKLNAVAPVFNMSTLAAPEWSEGFAELAWILYQNTGERHFITDNYESLKKLLEWETSEERKLEAEEYAADKLVNGTLPDYIYDSTWGDHVPPSKISDLQAKRMTNITATAFVYREALILKDMAEVLGKSDDALAFAELANNIKTAFNQNFWDEEKGYYHDAKVRKSQSGAYYGTEDFRQTPQILAIKFGLVEEENKDVVLSNLKNDIDAMQANGYSGLATGVIGTKYIFDVMTDNGLGEELYEVLNTDRYPGYGYWLENGATSMWEYWETNQRSDNHHMFGTIEKWFYQYLAGIQATGAGYKNVRIKPYILGDMSNASGTIQSSYGEISSSWEVAGDGSIILDVAIPTGVTATIYVPMNGCTTVEVPDGATSSSITEEGYEVYTVKSGTYQFIAK